MQERSFIALATIAGSLAVAGSATAANVNGVQANGFFDGPRAVVQHVHSQGAVNWSRHQTVASGWQKPAGITSWGNVAWSRSHGGGVLRLMPHPLFVKAAVERG